MATQEYKCPSCGGTMEFDPTSQKLKCPFCGFEMSIEEYKKSTAEKKTADENTRVSDEEAAQNGVASDKAVYICQSCGGEIIADKETGATTCPFCGNNVVFKEIFENGRTPDFVIPFKFKKEDAKKKYHEFVKGKKLVPKPFLYENHIDEIKGVYIPYWLYDTKADGSAKYEATKVKTWSDANYNYTDTSYYDVDRSGSVDFQKVPVDGSEKMPDDLTESIEPYDLGDLKPYDNGYLAGFLANKYDIDEEASKKRAQERILQSTADALRSTVRGYSSVTELNKHLNCGEMSVSYALYPVWILTTTWQDKHFLFAMNGQTGAFVGNLPLDKKAAFLHYLLYGAICSAIVLVLELIFRF